MAPSAAVSASPCGAAAARRPRARLARPAADVRQLAVKLVTSLGYQVIDVPEAASAWTVLERGDQIDLVLSDVVLPGGTSGPEFAEAARERFPDLKIVFMSGYAAEAAKHNGFLDPDQVILNKPFQRSELAQALYEALD